MRRFLLVLALVWSGLTLGAVFAGQWWTAVVCWLTTLAVGFAGVSWREPSPPRRPLRYPGTIDYICECGEGFKMFQPDVDMWCDLVTAHVASHRPVTGQLAHGLEAYRSAMVAEALRVRD